MFSKWLKVSVMFVFLLLAAGCGHNMVMYGKGFSLETTLNPQTYTLGIGVRFGNLLTVCARENTTVTLADKENGEAQSYQVAAGTSTTVTVKTGRQITGYYVDALKAGWKPQQPLEQQESKK